MFYLIELKGMNLVHYFYVVVGKYFFFIFKKTFYYVKEHYVINLYNKDIANFFLKKTILLKPESKNLLNPGLRIP